MFKKHYGLVYIRSKNGKVGRWTFRNYGKKLKGMKGRSWINAYLVSWYRDVMDKTPADYKPKKKEKPEKVINLTRIVPMPGPPEDYQGEGIKE